MAATLGLTACSGDDGDPVAGDTPSSPVTSASPTPSPSPDPTSDSPSPTPQSTAPTTALSPRRWPLTGLPAKHKLPSHPVFAVKIPNTAASDPQVGLAAADMVVEEIVEGGITRLVALYHSQLPKKVGPVRSMRGSDIGIVKPAHAVLVSSGGAPSTVRQMHQANVPLVLPGSGFWRSDARSAPYNLMLNLRTVAKRAPDTQGAGASYIRFGHPGNLPRGKPATSIDVVLSGAHTTHWEYRDGHYLNTNGYAADDGQFRARTVLAIRVPVGNAGYRDPAGNPVPEMHVTGHGKAWVFHQGRVVRARWSKDGFAGQLKLSVRSGGERHALRPPPGKVWVELIPKDSGGVSFTG